MEFKYDYKKMVPATLFFLFEEGRIIGAADVRHALNDFLLSFGGNIGYGIRPSDRQKGHGTELLKLTLENKILEEGKLVRRYWIKK